MFLLYLVKSDNIGFFFKLLPNLSVLHLTSHLLIMVPFSLPAYRSPNFWSTVTKKYSVFTVHFRRKWRNESVRTLDRKWIWLQCGEICDKWQARENTKPPKRAGNRDHDWIFFLTSDWLSTQYLVLWLAKGSRANHLREKHSKGKIKNNNNTEEAIMNRLIKAVHERRTGKF